MVRLFCQGTKHLNLFMFSTSILKGAVLDMLKSKVTMKPLRLITIEFTSS